ncbi:MAG: carbohydrate kinase [Phycisphaerae bacterium]|nr:carbohydrate kinase [Phycisphaerae bacterium]
MIRKKKSVVVGLGEILWDMLPDGRRLGGAPANFAYHCHALGADSFVVSAVGDDKDGADIFNSLTELGIETAYLEKVRGYPTGTVSVELDPNGHADYTIHSPVAWDTIQWSESLALLAEKCDAVCFGSLAQRNPVSRETIQQFLKSTGGRCLRVFDINIRQDYATEETVLMSLEHADILKLNDEELPVVASMLGIGETDESKTITQLLSKYDLNCVMLTKGPAGSTLYTQDEVSFCESRDVSVIDTVGAGDSFTAAAVMGFLAGKALKELHQRASRIADFVCTRSGATPVLSADLINC